MTQKHKKNTSSRGVFKNVNLFRDDGTNENPPSIPIEKIHLPDSQPRRYFSPEAMSDLIASVKKDGILQPLLVRTINDDYELVAGERRYRAAKEVGLEEVPVFIKEMSDDDAKQFALTENLQREDLNPVEETEAILNLLEIRLKTNRKQVISLLNQMANSSRKLTDNVVRSEENQIVEEVFKRVGRLSVESFRTHRLPLLNLPDHILDSIYQGKIAYTKAKLIAKVEDKTQEKQILKEAIDNSLSLNQIKEKIKLLTFSKEEETLSSRFDKTYKQVKRKKELWKEPKKRKKLESLLNQLEKLLDE